MFSIDKFYPKHSILTSLKFAVLLQVSLQKKKRTTHCIFKAVLSEDFSKIFHKIDQYRPMSMLIYNGTITFSFKLDKYKISPH